MKFTLISGLLAMAALSSAAPATASLGTLATLASKETSTLADEGLEKRANQIFSAWTNDNFKGTQANQVNPKNGACYDIKPQYNDQISSVGPTKGLHCYLWADYGCSGRELGSGGGIKYPGIAVLADYNFNDIASSFKCYYN